LRRFGILLIAAMPDRSIRRPSGDKRLVQIVDSALADTATRSGPWLSCRIGCTQCCVGVFAINQLDAVRLQDGLGRLAKADPERAARVRERVRQSALRLKDEFPGDYSSGWISEDEEAQTAFAEFADDEICPVLDPRTGVCDLYEHRPMTCRVFGPPVRSEGGLGICELCFVGATDEEIAACEMKPDPENLESKLLTKLEKASGHGRRTIVAMCLK
jgi:Fe-S-cluster containining protein